MTLGRRDYSEADMIRMQRDAEERVRDMQSRAKITVEQDNLGVQGNMSRNRNWSTGYNQRRQNNSRRPTFAQGPQSHGTPAPEAPRQEAHRQEPPFPHAEPESAPENNIPKEESTEKKTTTVVEDIMGALKLDEDYLLIIGLILILLNQRADTTLILALAYLLI